MVFAVQGVCGAGRGGIVGARRGGDLRAAAGVCGGAIQAGRGLGSVECGVLRLSELDGVARCGVLGDGHGADHAQSGTDAGRAVGLAYYTGRVGDAHSARSRPPGRAQNYLPERLSEARSSLLRLSAAKLGPNQPFGATKKVSVPTARIAPVKRKAQHRMTRFMTFPVA